ncbi:MAG: uroporphyrinogen decarboxylase family protein [Anaerolineae bacterium]
MPASFAGIKPDWEAFLGCIRREGTPERVHLVELFLDGEVEDAIIARYNLEIGLAPNAPYYAEKRRMVVQRFLGYDYVRCGLDGLSMPLTHAQTDDTAELRRGGGRSYMEEHRGPITNWAEFEAYPWPDPEAASTRLLEWYEANLPDDMCVVAYGVAHFAEYLTWLMGYETLCYALFDQRDLVAAIAERLVDIFDVALQRILPYERVKLVWGSDDMGFRSATLISPDDLREFVLPGHKLMARLSHEAGKPYILHACGNLSEIIDDLIDDVKIDAKHSFEDTIEDVREVKHTYGQRIALLGGLDLDFLCRADEEQVRERVRDTLRVCLPGGGYCLGTGNSVANYIPLRNYLAMIDEGSKFRL